MSLMSKNTLGAGDGITQTISKKRPQVASCRRFATRGVCRDQAVSKRLQDALEQFSTPPHSPLRKRSQTIAEITPSKNKREQTLRTTPSNHKSAAAATPDASGARIQDAGRRVSHQLVLNAWRRRRSQVATLNDSRNQLQTQVDQLEMQVDVLLKLRAAEGSRRTEATCESKNLTTALEQAEKRNEDLEKEIISYGNRESSLQEKIEKLNADMINMRNTTNTIVRQKQLCEQAYNSEKQQIQALREERDRLIQRIEECEREIEHEKHGCKSLEETINASEEKCLATMRKFEELQESFKELQDKMEEEQNNSTALELMVKDSQSRNKRLELKVASLKKTIADGKAMRKKQLEEHEEMKKNVEGLESRINTHEQKRWWRSTSELLGRSLETFAYILFPALPEMKEEPELFKYIVG